MGKKITVNDKMQQGYEYELTAPAGEEFHPDFEPHLTPKEMLELGVFGGKYCTDCKDEFPDDWFKNAKLSPKRKNPELNFFGVDASLPLSKWQEKGWIDERDPRGWFQWHMRYYYGRRLTDGEDERQIKRWKSFKRHWGAVEKNCTALDWDCRRKQRQALLHWAYDARKL